MDINNLIEYIYLAESLSFKNTADYFYVSRSVISRHLAALEEVVGVKLIERGNQSARLTEAGKVFYHETQTVLRAYANAVDRARAVGKTSNRVVRIGYLKNAARPVIVQFLRFMNHEHPDIQLDMTCMEYGDLRRAIDEGGVGIALAVNVDPRVSRNYRSTFIYEDRFFAVMSKDHPLAGHVEGISIGELPREKLLLPDSFVYAGLNDLVDELSEDDGQAAARAYYRDVDMLYLKVQTEGFIAFCSGLNSAMFGNKLAILPVTDIDSSFTVSAFYRDDLPIEGFEACRKGFEACNESMKSWDGSSEHAPIGFSLASFT